MRACCTHPRRERVAKGCDDVTKDAAARSDSQLLKRACDLFALTSRNSNFGGNFEKAGEESHGSRPAGPAPPVLNTIPVRQRGMLG